MSIIWGKSLGFQSNQLDIAFLHKAHRSVCADQTKATELLGAKAAAKLRARLSDIDAALSYSDIPLGNPRFITLDNVEYLIVDIDENTCLTFAVGHVNTPLNSDKKIDWNSVTTLKLIEIGPKQDAITRVSA